MSITTTIWGWFSGQSSTGNRKGSQIAKPNSIAFKRSKTPTLDQALQLSSFWAAVNLWSKTIASLPLNIQEYDDSKEQWVNVKDNTLQDLLNYKVNRYQTRIEFFKTLAFNLMANGNSYVHVQRENNKIISLLPLSSTQVEVKILDGGTKVYIYDNGDNKVVLAQDSVWHLMTFGNNYIGMSPLSFGANAIGMGLSADERATQVLDNAAKPSGILTFDNTLKLTPEQRKQIKEEFKALKEGTDNVLMTLESGWNYQQIGLNPQDVQLLESRRFSIEDVGRFLDAPSILLNDSTSSTGWGSGITQIIEGWYKLSLRPMTNYIAESAAINLLDAGKRKKQRFNFGFDHLLQLSRLERAEANQKEINSATMTPNEARKTEGRLPLDGGDELMINTALQPVDQYLQDLAAARGGKR